MPDTESKNRNNDKFIVTKRVSDTEEGIKRDNDDKFIVPRHVADAGEDALRDETEVYGDEGDVLLRRGKKKPARNKPAKGKKASGKEKSTADIPMPKFAPGKKKKKKTARKKRRTYHSIFEIMSATDSDGVFRPIRVFGREIRFWPLIVLAALVLLASGVMLNNSNLTVTEQTVTVVGLPEELEGYRIVVMSDMNGRRFGDGQNMLLRALNNMKYDAIFCLGDMVGKSGDPAPFWEFLDGLKNPGKVYFICGDCDPGPYVSEVRGTEGVLSRLVLEDWILGAIDRGAHYVDAPISLNLRSTTLWISPADMLNLETITTLKSWTQQTEQEEDGVVSGITGDYATLPITTYRKKLAQILYDAQRTMNRSEIHIALAHEVPSEDYIYTSEEHVDDGNRFLPPAELILAGHYCGGVWQLPGLGAIYVPDSTMDRGGWFPKQSSVSGLNTVGATQVYITRGMSTNGAVPLMPFRLFNAPEISVLTLTSRLPENMLEAG